MKLLRTLVPTLVLLVAAPAASGAERDFPRGFLWGTAIAGLQAEAGGQPDGDDAGQGQDSDSQTEAEDAPSGNEEAGEGSQEGESVTERPDSPDGEEAPGEES